MGSCFLVFILHPPPSRLWHLSLSLCTPLPPDSLHPTTLLSSPFGVVHLYGNNWSALPPALFKARFHHPPLFFVFIYLFIYLRTLPSPTSPIYLRFENVERETEREGRELRYLSGIVISRGSPSWLEFAPAEPSERLVALRWRGKVDFFFLRCLHSHIDLLFTLNQFASQYRSHLIFFFLFSGSISH